MEVNSARTGILPNEWGKDVCEGDVMRNGWCGAEAVQEKRCGEAKEGGKSSVMNCAQMVFG